MTDADIDKLATELALLLQDCSHEERLAFAYALEDFMATNQSAASKRDAARRLKQAIAVLKARK